MRYCSKMIAVLLLIVSVIFLNVNQSCFKILAEDSEPPVSEPPGDDVENDPNMKKVTLPLEEGASAQTEIPVEGKITVEEDASVIDPEDPDGGARKPEPNEPVAEIPAEPDKVVTTINRGFASISSIDTGDRQQWDYYKEIFLISGSILVILSLSQIFKKQQKTI